MMSTNVDALQREIDRLKEKDKPPAGLADILAYMDGQDRVDTLDDLTDEKLAIAVKYLAHNGTHLHDVFSAHREAVRPRADYDNPPRPKIKTRVEDLGETQARAMDMGKILCRNCAHLGLSKCRDCRFGEFFERKGS